MRKIRLLPILSLLLLAMMLPLASLAAPITDYPVTLSQPDGTELHLFISGDEYYNWIHDANGYVIMRNPETGFLVYAEKVGRELAATNYVVGVANPDALGIQPGLMLDEELIRERYLTKFAIPELPASMKTSNRAEFSSINNLAVFIRFSDETEISTSLSVYDNMFNQEGAGVNSQIEYFRAASYGQVDVVTDFLPTPSGDVIVSYQDTHPRGYYQPYQAGDNEIGYHEDTDEATVREQTLITNALEAVKVAVPPSMDLDDNNDGFVDNVVIIIKGDPDGWSDLLWPHMWALFTNTVMINGSQVWNYNLQLSDYLIFRGNGVICHEMGHTFGAPDYYHYVGNGISPVSRWDLMNSDTNPPQHFSSYTKFRYMGWVDTIRTVTESDTITLPSVAVSDEAAIFVPSLYSETEYFMLEYRDKTDDQFDGALPNSGLVVYRINRYVEGTGNGSGPPDELYVYRPDGSSTQNGHTDLAPLGPSTGRLVMNNTTNPSPFLSNGWPGGLLISDVQVVGDSIRFVVDFSIDGPENATVALVDTVAGTVSLSWSAPPEGTMSSYRIYRDFEVIDETTDLTYEDTLPDYGYYTYYVAGVYDGMKETGPSEIHTLDWVEPGVVVLLWDADPEPGSGAMLKQVLNNIGYGVNRVTMLSDAVPASYPVMFATLGMASDGEHYIGSGGAEEDMLIAYLEQGGILYMEGGDAFGWNPPGNLLPYFNLTNLDDGTADLSTVNGVAGTFTEGLVMDYAGVNDYIDHLEGGSGAQTILVNPADNVGCAVIYDEGTYKTIAVGFELGMLEDAAPPSTLYNLVSSIMEWTGVPNPGYVSSVGEEVVAGLPDRFQVLAPYPNPFNGITSVPIRLNRSGRVEVSTFDILGRLVASNDFQMHAGEHRVSLTMPANLASGVYYVRVGFQNQVKTRQIVLVK